MLLLGAAAMFSVLTSEMPRAWAWPLAGLAAAYAGGVLRRHWRLPRRHFHFPGNEHAVTLDGQPLRWVQVQWRGPLAFVSWQVGSGPRQHLAWWPDTLPAARRRELRLAAGALHATRRGPAMAP